MPSTRGSFSGVVGEDGVQYSFAMEYSGPPVTFDIPKAVPIDVETIPVASVVAQVSLSDKLSLPVVQPILPLDNRSKMFSKELKLLGCEPTVSPTSVIDGHECVSKEITLGSEASVSPHSVTAFESGVTDNQDCVLSGELCRLGALEFSNGRYGSSELLEMVNVCQSRSSISHGNSHELVGGAGSSGMFEFSEGIGKSGELFGSSCELRASTDFGKENLDANISNPPDWASSESVLSLDRRSSEVSSFRSANGKNLSTSDFKRPVVTFRGVDTDSSVNEESSIFEAKNSGFQKEPYNEAKKGKGGSCYRCSKGNRFTEKEVCIVCDAKYCSNCVLRAMGSMPEGRKCVSCIGFPIDESKRGNLGKCSRLLKRLLNQLEIQQIMKAEKLCEANQLPPEYILVNGKPLSHEELVILHSCPNPPKKLKPGNYWYDKVSGFWGKEGQKPSQIISPHLSVGGPINADASNGNTQVYINGREITKVELRMLQLVGVQCAGNPHFWVNDDGSYQEEGQKNTRGYLWGKAGAKLVCALLSLPIPSKSANSCGEQVHNLDARAVPDYLGQRTLQKLLLVGHYGSGTSTIFKQAKILYKATPFSYEERENIKLKIQSNLYNYLGILLEGREHFEEETLADMRSNQSSDESSAAITSLSPLMTQGATDGNFAKTIYSIGPRLKSFSDWLLKAMALGNLDAIFPAATREYAPVIEDLWNNAAIQVTYSRRNELKMLPTVASYFLERAADILRTDYEPSDVDILYAEGVTSSNGLISMEFSFAQPEPDDSISTADQHDSLLRYQLVRVPARGLGENCKWLEMFEDVRMVIFCVALSDYDQFCIDGNGPPMNKMLLSRRFFESIITHPTFDQMDFLLILNKFDLFEEKIEDIPLSLCEWFDDFHPVTSRHRSNGNSSNINSNPTLGQVAFHYIAVKFKRLYSSLTGRKLFVSSVRGLEPTSVDSALKYAREILKWDEERINFTLSEYSIYSTEASSFSQ
ncbi:Guanine nucleotide binding protein (G-protein), alpha subunit [Dillenia turbinata]|uniref:Guanine nucleotide binding protein (G-protein), alpha subunit n=1 Tax=Dillenia turbinata TaxID=194707 RepID=A0AAN8V4W2_9MAGN